MDYKLRSPGNKATTSAYLAFDSWGGGALEVDVARPIGKALSLGLGAALYNNEFGDGTDTIQNVQALSLRWTPSSRLEVQPFWQRSFVSDDVGPIYSPAGPYLPPRLPRRRFAGPTWADHEGTSILYGFHGKVALGRRTILRAGLFRSLLEDRTGAANLYTGLIRDGQARHIVLIDPPGSFGSNSGEVRLTQSFSHGRWVHLVHASLRGRDRQRIYGGSAQVDLGSTDILRVIRVPRPMLRFSTQSEDRVRQLTAGIAYEGRWKGVGELSLGLQRTSYRKRVRLPDLAAAVTSSDPWLLNATVALHVSNSVAVYVGYVSGLEESGIAPANALNRNEPLSAIKTSQRDAGLRWTIRPGLRFVVGAFDIRKPYFQLDESNIFSLLGDVRNRGLEFSLSGKISPRLVMIAGAVLSKPVVDGEGIRLGRIGSRPVGLASSTFRLNGDWRPTIAEKLSLDFGIGYTSRRPSTRDNSVFVPSRIIIDIGARYKTREGNDPLTLRLAAANVFDAYAPEVLSSGSYYANPGRVVTLSLASDF